jgi:hypothetical protein
MADPLAKESFPRLNNRMHILRHGAAFNNPPASFLDFFLPAV